MTNYVPSCYDCKHYKEHTIQAGGFTSVYREACKLTKYREDKPEKGNPIAYRRIENERGDKKGCGKEGKNFRSKPTLYSKLKLLFVQGGTK